MDKEEITKIVEDILAEKRFPITQADIPRETIKQGHIEQGAMVIFRGTATNRPDGKGEVKAYFATDTNVLSIYNGSAWKAITLSAIDTGWIVSNKTEDKTIDADGAVAEIGDGLTTLIDTLITSGILSA